MKSSVTTDIGRMDTLEPVSSISYTDNTWLSDPVTLTVTVHIMLLESHSSPLPTGHTILWFFNLSVYIKLYSKPVISTKLAYHINKNLEIVIKLPTRLMSSLLVRRVFCVINGYRRIMLKLLQR